MNETNRITGTSRHPGRLYLVLGVLAPLVGIGIYVGQLQAKILIAPWYVPILATLGVLLLATALVRSRSVWRWLAMLVFTLLAAGQWLMMLVLLSAPDYTGPVRVEQPFPDFTTTLADGSTFTQQSLKGDKNTIMVFFRGRW